MDTEQIAETKEKAVLWKELLQVTDNDFDPAVLTQYLEAIQDEPSQQFTVDVEEMLAKFKCRHQVLMESVFSRSLCPASQVCQKEEKQQSRFQRIKRSGKALMIAAAVLSCVTIVAAGENKTLIAEWGAELLHFYGREEPHQTYWKSEDGRMIYFSDGSAIDRYGSITPDEEKLYLEGKMTKEEILARHADEHSEMEEETRKARENGELVPVQVGPLPFKVDETIQEAAAQYGITEKLFPTWVPEDLERAYTQVTLYENGELRALSTFYEDKSTDRNVDFSYDIYNLEGAYVIEKDSRPVEIYTKGGVDYYLVYNLDTVNASAVVGQRMINIGGRISMDELKK